MELRERSSSSRVHAVCLLTGGFHGGWSKFTCEFGGGRADFHGALKLSGTDVGSISAGEKKIRGETTPSSRPLGLNDYSQIDKSGSRYKFERRETSSARNLNQIRQEFKPRQRGISTKRDGIQTKRDLVNEEFDDRDERVGVRFARENPRAVHHYLPRFERRDPRLRGVLEYSKSFESIIEELKQLTNIIRTSNDSSSNHQFDRYLYQVCRVVKVSVFRKHHQKNKNAAWSSSREKIARILLNSRKKP